ncbi:hypothetical protein LINPERPRIM_LOCUS12559 [Linum perenne]
MDGANRPLRLLQAGIALRRHHKDTQELLLLPRQLHNLARDRPRRLPNLTSFLSHHARLPPRRVVVPLLVPPLRPAAGGHGPDLLGPGDSGDLDACDRGGDFLD